MNAHQDTPGPHPVAQHSDGLPQQSAEAGPGPGPARPEAPRRADPAPSGGTDASTAPRTCPAPNAEAAHRLARARNVWLCTTRADGTPHVTPVWFVHHLDRWWIGSDERAVKVRNVWSAPTVSLALEDGDHPLVAEGTTRVLAAPFPPDIVAAFREKYDWDVSAPRPHAGARVLLEVRTRRWLLAGTAR
ncbi:pyridoxamine 5'-phosphate oxidase family protein [Streptomyces sp. NPDC004959]|uniref:pyridoxamine 5'-phosphate oxidase family protein n=1 Tax=unclassified Streptomyces TaxID=2593676 RepID=UPI000A697281|nr:pyridoxamine 5'-phosphate oxidase family protein [Streptomyces sp. NRRL F-5630]